MEIATQPSQSIISRTFFPAPNPPNSMSHGFYGLPADGVDRSGEPGSNVVGPMVGDYHTMYDSGGASAGSMLSDMFDFPQPATVDVLQIPSTGYRLPPPVWPGKQESQLLPDPSAAMRLFLMTPQERGSTSPPRQQAHQDLQTNHPALIHSASFGSSTSYTGGGGGLSLSLSPNLQRLEMAKVEGGLGINNNSSSYYDQQVNVGGVVVNGQSGGVAQMLRQSKYATAAQELLQEFCSVGKGQVKGGKRQRGGSSSSNPNPSSGHAGGGGGGSCSNSKEGGAVLSPSDRFEQQRRKAKLLAMLDEVDRRYSHYCEQMQSVVTSFDSVMGFGAAVPYTALAQKAMSRHFRCLKDAVAAQLKETCEVLGEKDCSVSLRITKGETPRLKLLDQSLRQQRAFHQMGMMETEAWRPQRGLPERSVNILRSWLFEHFLHPYPSDSDKHMLARQTGLSRNQVSNWFINARVRLWKPMIEEMYQQEAQDAEDKSVSRSEPSNPGSRSPTQTGTAQIAPASHAQSILVHRHQYQHQQQFSSSSLDNPQFLSTYQPSGNSGNNEVSLACLDLPGTAELCGFDMPTPDYGVGMVDQEAGRIRFGASGDVSLTLGLRHAGNVPEASRFSVRDFGGL